MEAHEEVDIVIGDKKRVSLRYSYRVHQHGDRNVMQRFYLRMFGRKYAKRISGIITITYVIMLNFLFN